jgi:hypothetical protein
MIRFLCFCLAAFWLSGFSAFAQSAKDSRSQIEAALSKKGVLLKKDRKNLGNIHDVSFTKLTVEDLTSKLKYSGIEVISGKVVGFIDNDELPTLKKAVELMRDKRLDEAPGTFYEFHCRGGFNLMFFWIDQKWNMRVGVGEKYEEDVSYAVETIDLLKLIKFVSDAAI